MPIVVYTLFKKYIVLLFLQKKKKVKKWIVGFWHDQLLNV